MKEPDSTVMSVLAANNSLALDAFEVFGISLDISFPKKTLCNTGIKTSGSPIFVISYIDSTKILQGRRLDDILKMSYLGTDQLEGALLRIKSLTMKILFPSHGSRIIMQ